MKFEQLVLLLPCYSLETFDFQRKEEDAEQLLGGWSALWHPRLIAGAQNMPRWMPAESPPQDPAGHLIVVPDCCESLLPEDWLSQAEASGACILRKMQRRDAMVAAALERLDPDATVVDPELAADFLALGHCYFQIELMTRKLRYMSNLDESSLRTATLAAAEATLKGDGAAARENLQAAFDRLHESREYFYPTSARLLDLTLVAPSTLGETLRQELAGSVPSNLLLAGETLDAMAAHEPATLDALKLALEEKRAALIGGEYVETPLPLLDLEAIAEHLRHGLAVYQKHLGQRPKIFGRRRFGLTPTLPSILNANGFSGALHFTLDDGQFPTGNQSRIQWEGLDGTSIEAVGCVPLDAGRSDSFLRLAEALSNAMNLDQASTIIFAHWPGAASPWYEDMRRIAAYGSAFGTFVSIDAYFEQTLYSSQRNHYKPDQYRAPYLTQDVASGRHDPISRWKRYFARRAVFEAAASVETLAALGAENTGEAANLDELAAAVEASLQAKTDAACGDLDEKLAEGLESPLARFARAVIGAASSTERGPLVVNPQCFSLQANIPAIPKETIPFSSDENRDIPPASSSPALAVDVPAMGFAWADQSIEPSKVVERKGWFGRRVIEELPPLAEEYTLRNEFFEAHFDPQTGAIRAISDYQSRDPRLAQQIALRIPQGGDPNSDQNYSIMAADEIRVTSAGPVLGEIVSRGRLMDREGRRVAGFAQTTRAWRGSRILGIQLELEIDRQPGPRPWDSYYAARFAWKDEAAVVHRSVNMTTSPTELTQFESPYFVDISREKRHTTIFSCGLPFHRRLGTRRLDTLLAVQGETCRSFRFGIGIDVPNPMAAALGFLMPPLAIADQPPPAATSGWLFHFDCRNVLATHWRPLLDASTGKTLGFRVHLLETDGHGVRFGLRCCRAVATAHQAVPDEATPMELVVEGDRINVPLNPHEWVEIEARF